MAPTLLLSFYRNPLAASSALHEELKTVNTGGYKWQTEGDLNGSIHRSC